LEDRPPEGPRPGGGHPADLPAYVGGTLAIAEARSVEAHLQGCPACREEVRALASMKAALRWAARADHVRPEDLMALAADEISGERRASVLAHVELCPSCAEDASAVFASVGRPWPASTPAPGRAVRIPARRAVLAAAAGAILLAVIAAWALWRPSGPAVEPVSLVTLSTQLRGEGPPVVLRGRGPWHVMIVLPASVRARRHALRIVDERDRSVFSGEFESDRDNRVHVLVRSIDRPGRYRMVLQPRSASDPPCVYPFERAADRSGGAS
jgi:hypothetical protein